MEHHRYYLCCYSWRLYDGRCVSFLFLELVFDRSDLSPICRNTNTNYKWPTRSQHTDHKLLYVVDCRLRLPLPRIQSIKYHHVCVQQTLKDPFFFAGSLKSNIMIGRRNDRCERGGFLVKFLWVGWSQLNVWVRRNSTIPFRG